MNLRALLCCVALAGCSSPCDECKKPADGVVTLTIHDGNGALVPSPTFSLDGKSLDAACTKPSASTCPSWTFSLEPGSYTIDVTDGNSEVATSVPIEIVARSCGCDTPAPVSQTVALASAT